MFAADDDAALPVAGMLGKFAGRGCLYDGAAHAPRKAHPLSDNAGARLAKRRKRLGIVAKLDADLFEDRIGMFFD